jgi:hypothetical protein
LTVREDITRRVYRPVPTDDFAWMQGSTASERRVLRHLGGHRIESGWTDLQMNLVDTDDDSRALEVGTLFWVNSRTFATSTQTKASLEEAISDDVQFLPIVCKGERYWIANVFRVIDALDRASTTLTTLPSGVLASIDRPRFVESNIPPSTYLFKIREQPQSRYYVTRDLVDLLIQQRLRGIVFRPCL